MKEIVGSILRRKAFEIAEQTITSLTHQNKMMTAFIGNSEHSCTYLVFVEILHLLLNAIQSGNMKEFSMKAKTMSQSTVQYNIPIRHILANFRQFRQTVLRETQKHAETFTSLEDYQELLSVERLLQEYLDQFIEMFVCDYEYFMQAEPMAKKSLLKDEEWFDEMVSNELAQVIRLSQDIAVLIIDENLRIKEVNHALAEFLNVDRDKLIGENIDDIFKPHAHQRFVQWVVERGESGHYITEIVGKLCTVSTKPIYMQGELWGAIAIIRDLTRFKTLEDELNKREALASVGQLAAGMAHEIRNPLTSIKGFIQLLREQTGTNEGNAYFPVILSEIERIDGLINDVLVLARYRDDQMVSEDFQIIEEVIGVIRLLEPELNRHGISINLKVDTKTTWIHGYRARIKQVLLNLMKNALEALAEQGTMISVHVFSTIHQVVVSVEDDGLGIPVEVRDQLFVPFFTTKSEGSGLGLSTTKRIVDDHGGEIIADNSEVYGGARFEVRLPLLSGK
ncbi:two-component system sensor histidine kinase NtrB [Brevibacillus ginsengisoli]|uniref:two-component system sensor histidine kinase NtrB n=1 Tax=Brevibacillus ginsengisoli TaxID=363854 RepID=UPI003CEB6ADA